MTNYVRIKLGVEVSESDDYQPADHRFGPQETETTVAFVVKGTGLAPANPAVYTISLSDYTTVHSFAFINTDSANQVDVEYESSVAAKQVVAAGQPLLLASASVGTDITVGAEAGKTATFEYILLVTA